MATGCQHGQQWHGWCCGAKSKMAPEPWMAQHSSDAAVLATLAWAGPSTPQRQAPSLSQLAHLDMASG